MEKKIILIEELQSKTRVECLALMATYNLQGCEFTQVILGRADLTGDFHGNADDHYSPILRKAHLLIENGWDDIASTGTVIYLELVK